MNKYIGSLLLLTSLLGLFPAIFVEDTLIRVYGGLVFLACFCGGMLELRRYMETSE